MLKYEEAIKQLVFDIFAGRVVGKEVRESIVQFVVDKVMPGVFDGFGKSFSDVDYDTPDFGTLAALEKNVYYFGTAKNYNQLKEINLALKDSKGKIRPFNDFKKDAANITDRYNINWLEAEYNHAVASAQMTRRWHEIQEAKSILPMLSYETAGDERVRIHHAELEGITKPVDDPFWDLYYPPNGWNCRCDVLQTDDKETPNKRMKYPEVVELFKTNTAKQGIVYPNGHPYYALPKNEIKKVKKDAKAFWKANGEGHKPKKKK